MMVAWHAIPPYKIGRNRVKNNAGRWWPDQSIDRVGKGPWRPSWCPHIKTNEKRRRHLRSMSPPIWRLGVLKNGRPSFFFHFSIALMFLSPFNLFSFWPIMRCWNVVNAINPSTHTLWYGRVINPFVFFFSPPTPVNNNNHMKTNKKVVGFPSSFFYRDTKGGCARPAGGFSPACSPLHWPSEKEK